MLAFIEKYEGGVNRAAAGSADHYCFRKQVPHERETAPPLVCLSVGDETLHYLHYGKMLDEPQQAQLVVLHQLVVQLSKCDGATMTHQFVCALTPYLIMWVM